MIAIKTMSLINTMDLPKRAKYFLYCSSPDTPKKFTIQMKWHDLYIINHNKTNTAIIGYSLLWVELHLQKRSAEVLALCTYMTM